jgi:beta-barrel assembly-enhancing protease
MKTIIKGLSIVVAFIAVWLALAQIDFVGLFKIKQAKNATEQSIGDIIWDEIKKSEEIIVNDTITKTIDKLLKPLCDENDIERDSLKVHIIKKDEINAFALPDNHLVIYTGLIESAKNESALIGVIGHEVAHIENRHVMKKLSREIGFSILLSLTTGNNNAETIRTIFKTLSNSSYEQSLEREADLESVEYMLNAKMDPAPFADFLYEFSFENEYESQLAWISSHPESEERAKYILEYIKGKKLKKVKILTQKEWDSFKNVIKNNI